MFALNLSHVLTKGEEEREYVCVCMYVREYMCVCVLVSRGGIERQRLQYVGGEGVKRNTLEGKRAKRKSNKTFQFKFEEK